MNESRIGLIRALENTGRTAGPGPDFLTGEATAAAHRIHRELPGYAPTPLVGLDALAKRLGVRGFYVKDESKRFGLNAFKGLGGIFPDPDRPGFAHILLRPHFVGPERFEARFDSPRGEIVSKWERHAGRVTYTVRIPANATATLTLPATVAGERTRQLDAGTYTFELPLLQPAAPAE